MKPGYQTTEFWLTVSGTLVNAILASGLLTAGSPYAQLVGLIGTTVLPTIYSFLRNQQKQTTTTPTALPTLEEAQRLMSFYQSQPGYVADKK